MTTKLYAIHDSKRLMVSDARFDKLEAWQSFFSDSPAVDDIVSRTITDRIIYHETIGYTCDTVVVSNPKTEVVLSRDLYNIAADRIKNFYAGGWLGGWIKQFLEAGNENP